MGKFVKLIFLALVAVFLVACGSRDGGNSSGIDDVDRNETKNGTTGGGGAGGTCIDLSLEAIESKFPPLNSGTHTLIEKSKAHRPLANIDDYINNKLKANGFILNYASDEEKYDERLYIDPTGSMQVIISKDDDGLYHVQISWSLDNMSSLYDAIKPVDVPLTWVSISKNFTNPISSTTISNYIAALGALYQYEQVMENESKV
ncbi:MAG: hypothetical protein LBS73_06655 [Campylobacteraceae bacterium]|jgi:hypothetical protein|nr:hypothetical protein [Campylobacteraceae bacterium]